jgi:hypothetical protein
VILPICSFGENDPPIVSFASEPEFGIETGVPTKREADGAPIGVSNVKSNRKARMAKGIRNLKDKVKGIVPSRGRIGYQTIDNFRPIGRADARRLKRRFPGKSMAAGGRDHPVAKKASLILEHSDDGEKDGGMIGPGAVKRHVLTIVIPQYRQCSVSQRVVDVIADHLGAPAFDQDGASARVVDQPVFTGSEFLLDTILSHG